jgi:uncharacterized protein (DUF2225 family)
MNLFSGLEKFGFSGDEEFDIFKDDKKKKKKVEEPKKKVVKPLEEKDLVLKKTVKCPICDQSFVTLAAKTAKLKRLEPDFDLRPNFEVIDTVKYDVTACPHCGYAAMNRYFDHISTVHAKLVRQEVCSKFRPTRVEDTDTYSYDQAIDRFKLSLISTMAKRAKMSEKAYNCLKIAWLDRAKLKTMPNKAESEKMEYEAVQKEYEGFYKQAYEGFLKASSTETPPFCGMDTSTLDFMLANMSMHYKRYDIASKLVARLLGSSGVSSRVKDKCLELKKQIVVEAKKQQLAKQQAAENAEKEQ